MQIIFLLLYDIDYSYVIFTIIWFQEIIST